MNCPTYKNSENEAYLNIPLLVGKIMRNEYLDVIMEIAEYAAEFDSMVCEYKSAPLQEMQDNQWNKLYTALYRTVEKGNALCESLQDYRDLKVKKPLKHLKYMLSQLERKLVEVGQVDDGTHPYVITGINKFLNMGAGL